MLLPLHFTSLARFTASSSDESSTPPSLLLGLLVGPWGCGHTPPLCCGSTTVNDHRSGRLAVAQLLRQQQCSTVCCAVMMSLCDCDVSVAVTVSWRFPTKCKSFDLLCTVDSAYGTERIDRANFDSTSRCRLIQGSISILLALCRLNIKKVIIIS